LQSGRNRIILKNPPDTGKMRYLAATFPQAKFIYIQREPLVVLKSTQNMWKNYVPTTALEVYDQKEDLPYIVHVYKRQVMQYMEDKKLMSPGQLVEVKYEDFRASPMKTVERIYSELGLSGLDEARPAFEEFISSVSDYQNNKYKADEELAQIAWEELRPIYEHFGYPKPSN